MFFLEIWEAGHRIPTGERKGYKTLDEAIKAAERMVDDALPNNTVRIMKEVGYAALGGDGEAYSKIHDPE
jgi:hypothetical protein